MNLSNSDGQSQEQNNSFKNNTVKGNVTYAPQQTTIYNSPESVKSKRERERFVEVVKTEVKDRLVTFEKRKMSINFCLESKPEFLSHFDRANCRMKQEVDNVHNKQVRDIEALLDLFKEGRQPKSLLIVGEHASGKSTILCRIAEVLLEKAREDEQQPVPVYFSVRSWEGEDFKDWLKKESHNYYGTPFDKKNCLEKILYKILGKKIYYKITSDNSHKVHPIEPENLVILLDHFELVKQDKQEKFIKSLNKHNKDNIILCSSFEAFKHYIAKDENKAANNNKLLEFSEAFLLKLPTSSQISEYLDSILNELNSDLANKLKTLIQPGKQLENITKSLFILNLVIDNYETILKEEVPEFQDSEKLYQYILDEYIKSNLEEIDYLIEHPKEAENIIKPIEKSYWEYIKPKVMPMLKWLAQEMGGDRLSSENNRPKPHFWIEEMQPTSLKGIQTIFYRFGSLLLAVILSFLVGTLHLLIQPVHGWKYTLLTGMSGAIFVFFFLLFDEPEIKPVEKIEWNFQTVKNNSIKAVFSFPVALIIGFLCSFLEKWGIVQLYEQGFERVTRSSISEFILGIIYTLFITVTIVVLYSITAGISSSRIKKIKPNQGIWTSSYNAAATGFRVFLSASIIF